MDVDSDMLLRHDVGGVATLTLNRPDSRNPLSLAMIRRLFSELEGIEAETTIRVVVIASTGPAFCAGHDLKELRAMGRSAHRPLFDACSQLMLRIVSLRCPVVAQIQGVATAAGCQLVATCDLAIAAESARFAAPGVKIGLFCSTPMVALTRAIGRKAALEMLLTGEMIDAATAQRLGLINRVVPDAELAQATAAIAAGIAGKSGATIAIGKRAFYQQAEMPLSSAYDFVAAAMDDNMGIADAVEGIDAFLQKRDPVWVHG